MTDVVLKLERIGKYYGSQRILTGIDLQLSKGEVMGVVGPNGSGKSTLLKIVLGLVYPTDGVKSSGSSFVASSAMLDKPGFFPGFCLEKNLVIFAGNERSPELYTICEQLGLKPYLRKQFKHCSTGVQKRCELAAALLRNPQLLVMDEPVSGLDPAGICAFRSIIRDLRRREASVLIADHTLTELENICTHICFLRKGMISCIAPVDELLKRFDNLGEAYRYYNLTIS